METKEMRPHRKPSVTREMVDAVHFSQLIYRNHCITWDEVDITSCLLHSSAD